MYTCHEKSTPFELFAKELAKHRWECDTIRVRVSYEDDVPFQSYISLVNECERNHISHLEMVTSVPLVMVSQ